MPERIVEEMLESLWTCEEQGRSTVDAVLQGTHLQASRSALEEMRADGMLTLDGERVELTAKGRAEAAVILRRHRLAERLLADALGMDPSATEAAACGFEHAVLPEVAEAICTLLGHPVECPHGRPIPPGECCRERRQEARRALTPLAEAPLNRWLRVAYLRTRHHDRLHLLLSLGLGPGANVRLHQRTPVLVVQVDQSEFALDRDVAADVVAWLEPERG
jgi:DtxR family Mn-dependent transcriptional regulator